METRRRVMTYTVIAVVGLGLIGWLTARYMVKRSLLLQLGTSDLKARVEPTRRLLEMKKLEVSLPAQPIIRRSKAAEALGEIGTEEAMRLLGVILRDQEEAPRRWARRALVKQGIRAVPTLMAALPAGGGTTEEAVKGLVEIAQTSPQVAPDVRMLLADRSALAPAAEILSKTGEVGIRALIQGCYNADGDLRKAAMKNLGLQRVKAAVDACLDNLRPIPGSEKGAAITALGLIGDRRAAPAIIPFLTDQGNRTAAATALGLIGDPRAVEPLVATLSATEREYRAAAILALRRIGPPAFPALVRELKSPDVLFRRGAASALIGSRSAQVNGPLAAALRDPDADVRASAASALGWQGNTAAIDPLVAALSDPSWRVVDASVEALGEIGVSGIDRLAAVLGSTGNVTVSYQISRALGHMGSAAVPKLISLLSSGNPNVQKWSAVALGAIGDPRAVEPLKELAKVAQGDLKWVVDEQLRLIVGIRSS